MTKIIKKCNECEHYYKPSCTMCGIAYNHNERLLIIEDSTHIETNVQGGKKMNEKLVEKLFPGTIDFCPCCASRDLESTTSIETKEKEE